MFFTLLALIISKSIPFNRMTVTATAMSMPFLEFFEPGGSCADIVSLISRRAEMTLIRAL